jgi:hypothetical protein
VGVTRRARNNTMKGRVDGREANVSLPATNFVRTAATTPMPMPPA